MHVDACLQMRTIDILFEVIGEASLDMISNEGCDLIPELSDEEGKRHREE